MNSSAGVACARRRVCGVRRPYLRAALAGSRYVPSACVSRTGPISGPLILVPVWQRLVSAPSVRTDHPPVVERSRRADGQKRASDAYQASAGPLAQTWDSVSFPWTTDSALPDACHAAGHVPTFGTLASSAHSVYASRREPLPITRYEPGKCATPHALLTVDTEHVVYILLYRVDAPETGQREPAAPAHQLATTARAHLFFANPARGGVSQEWR